MNASVSKASVGVIVNGRGKLIKPCVYLLNRRLSASVCFHSPDTLSFLFSLPSLFCLARSGLPLELYSLWHQYPWQLGDLMCRMKTLVLEGTANASVLTLGKCLSWGPSLCTLTNGLLYLYRKWHSPWSGIWQYAAAPKAIFLHHHLASLMPSHCRESSASLAATLPSSGQSPWWVLCPW